MDAGAQASQFCLQGMIEEGKHTPNAIDGEDFEITPGTWVVGLVIPGALAVVKGTVSRNGRRVAKSITIMNPK
ncbi:MAG: hypothetical protein K1X83_04675 [Oligoflexia bacterium]|nr:hypothetical protein [Oligoflexia bacterium]